MPALTALQSQLLEKINAADVLYRQVVHLTLLSMQVGKAQQQADETIRVLAEEYPALDATEGISRHFRDLKGRIDGDLAKAKDVHEAALGDFLEAWTGSPSKSLTMTVGPNWGEHRLEVSHVRPATSYCLGDGLLAYLSLSKPCDLGVLSLELFAAYGGGLAIHHVEDDLPF